MALFDFASLRTSVRALGDQIAELRSQLEQRKQRYEWLENAPRHPEDLVELVDRVIETNGKEWASRLDAALDPYERKPTLEPSAQKPLALLTAVKPDSTPTLFALEQALLSINGDLVRRAVREHISRRDASACGPRLVERKAELAKLDQEIVDLERREEELVVEAAKAGIRLP